MRKLGYEIVKSSSSVNSINMGNHEIIAEVPTFFGNETMCVINSGSRISETLKKHEKKHDFEGIRSNGT